jgi:Protein of unknown function (DUF4232)
MTGFHDDDPGHDRDRDRDGDGERGPDARRPQGPEWAKRPDGANAGADDPRAEDGTPTVGGTRRSDGSHDLGDRPPELELGLEPVESLLLPVVDVLPVPPGSFERIRRGATRRRRVRTAAGGGLAAALVAASLVLFGSPGSLWGGTPPITATGGSLGPVVARPSPSSGSPSASAPPSGGITTGPTGTGRSAVPSASGGTGGAAGQSQSGAAGSSSTVPGGGTGSGSAAGTPMCATSQLTASLGGGDAGAGNLYRYLLLTNHSGTTCTVSGFPGLSLLTAQGKELGAPAVFDHTFSYSTLTVRPGQTVSDTIHTLNSGATSCQGTSSSLRIYPPGNKADLVIRGQVMLCGNLLQVTPFGLGSSGNPSNAAGSGGAGAAPSAAPSSAPTTGSGQVGVVPSGAPDTGLPLTSGSGGSSTGLIAGGSAAGAAVLGGLGLGLRRRRSQAQG